MSHTYGKIVSKGHAIFDITQPNGNPHETTNMRFHSYSGGDMGRMTRISIGKGDGEFMSPEISIGINKSAMVEMIKIMTEWVANMEPSYDHDMHETKVKWNYDQ